MGFVSSVLGFFGFGIGVSAGILIGYFLLIYFHPSDVKVCCFLGYSMFSVDPFATFDLVLHSLK